MYKDLFEKYIHNKITKEETRKLISELQKEENINSFEKLKKIKLWWSLLNFEEEDVDNAYIDFKRKHILQHTFKAKWIYNLKIASVAVILIGVGLLLSLIFSTKSNFNDNSKLVYNKSMEIISPNGQITKIILPDSSCVTLNCGSSISYNYDFLKGIRNVKLKGEAFFKVSKDKLHPFQVLVDGIHLKVYGTSFNVSAYPSDKKITTTLLEGSLGIINNKDKELVRLIPGNHVEFTKSDGNVNLKSVDTSIYTSWQKGIIPIQNETLSKIIEKIERWYNVKVIVKNELLLKERYMGTIVKDKPVEQILQMLKANSSIQYKIVKKTNERNTIYLN